MEVSSAAQSKWLNFVVFALIGFAVCYRVGMVWAEKLRQERRIHEMEIMEEERTRHAKKRMEMEKIREEEAIREKEWHDRVNAKFFGFKYEESETEKRRNARKEQLRTDFEVWLRQVTPEGIYKELIAEAKHASERQREEEEKSMAGRRRKESEQFERQRAEEKKLIERPARLEQQRKEIEALRKETAKGAIIR